MSIGARDPSRQELREATLSGVRSVAGARVGVECLVFGSSLVLARLISPAEFGHAVIALIVVGLATSLLPAILGTRLVQRDQIAQDHVEAATWLSLVAGGVLFAIAFFVGPVITAPVFGAETADLVRLASPAFLLAAITVTPQAILQRRLDFARLSRIELAGSALGAVVAVSAAVAGMGATSIVIGALPAIALTAVLSTIAAGSNRPRPHRHAIADLVRFGLPAGIGSLGATSIRNVDYVILGAMLGPAQLGVYWRGFQLAVEYQRKITVVMLRLAFPVYSRTKDLDHLRSLRTRIVRVHASVVYPLLGLLVATAPVLVPFLYGADWAGAVLPAQILAVGGVTITAQTGIGPLMLAMGKAKPLMIFAWVATVGYGAAAWIGAGYGLIPACIAVVTAAAVLFLAGRYFLESRIAGIPMSTMVQELGPALVGTAVLVGISATSTEVLANAGVGAFPLLAVSVLLGLAGYLLTLRAVSRDAWSDLTVLVERLRRRGDRDEPARPPIREVRSGQPSERLEPSVP